MIKPVSSNSYGAYYRTSVTSNKSTTSKLFSQMLEGQSAESCAKADSVSGAKDNVLSESTSDTEDQVKSVRSNEWGDFINQSVTSRNPYDGYCYYVDFTDGAITCDIPGGGRLWTISLEGEGQQEKLKKVADYFKNFTPEAVKEFYSGDELGMATLKNFWLNMFGEPTESYENMLYENMDNSSGGFGITASEDGSYMACVALDGNVTKQWELPASRKLIEAAKNYIENYTGSESYRFQEKEFWQKFFENFGGNEG